MTTVPCAVCERELDHTQAAILPGYRLVHRECATRDHDVSVSRDSLERAREARIIEQKGLPKSLSYFAGQRAARGR